MTDITNTHVRAQFNHLGENVFGAFKTAKAIGIWDSEIIDGTEFLLIWKAIEWSATLQSDSDRVYVFTRSGDTDSLAGTEWTGPISESISEEHQFIQIRIVIVGTTKVNAPYPSYYGNEIGPTVDRMTLKGTTSITSSLFFSKTFDIGFAPKSIVLTNESDVPEGSILKFGVTSLDSVNLNDYQFIDANKTVNLDQLSVAGQSMKFVIEMSGNSNDEVIVHEFAAMFGGDDGTRVNNPD